MEVAQGIATEAEQRAEAQRLRVGCLLFSALVHDAGHPGVMNTYLNAIDHPIAQRVPDRTAVLERHHASVALAPSYSQLVYDALRLQNCGQTPSSHHSLTSEAAAHHHHSQPPLYVSPAESLSDALQWRRQQNSSRDIVLKAGVHFLNCSVDSATAQAGASYAAAVLYAGEEQERQPAGQARHGRRPGRRQDVADGEVCRGTSGGALD